MYDNVIIEWISGHDPELNLFSDAERKIAVGSPISLAKYNSGQKVLHELFSKHFPLKETEAKKPSVNWLSGRNIDVNAKNVPDPKLIAPIKNNFLDELLKQQEASQSYFNNWSYFNMFIQMAVMVLVFYLCWRFNPWVKRIIHRSRLRDVLSAGDYHH